MTEKTGNQFEGELKDLIARNLPAHVGNALQERLALIPKLEGDIRRLESLGETRAARIDMLEKDLRAANALLKRHDDISMRERDVIQRENNLAIDLAQKDVACAQNVVHKYEQLMGMIFKNPSYRESVYKSDNGGQYTQNGMLQPPRTECITKTVEQE